MGETRRQEIARLLGEAEWSFEELRAHLQISVRLLEDDLRHVERTLRRGHRRLRVDPARCEACGFAFRNREPKHWHPPSRCPRCRSERIREARLRVEG